MTTPDALDRRRSDLSAEIEHLSESIDHDTQKLECLRARWDELNSAIGLMRASFTEPEMAGPKRRNIAAEVHRVLGQQPMTVREIAKAIGDVKLSAVERAIQWHSAKENASYIGFRDGKACYIRSGATLQEAAE